MTSKEELNQMTKRLQKAMEDSKLSYGEIAAITNIPKSAVHRYISGETPKIPLDRLNIIASALGVSAAWVMGWDYKKVFPSESITILDGKIRKIPLFESVAAGFGCFANNQVIDYIPLMIDSDDEAQNTICIKVSGDSMYPKIEHGDTIVVHKQSSIDSGSIGVFLIDNEEGVVKKANYIYGENWLELISLNPEYMPRRFDGPDVERVKTLGLVKQVIKNI